MPRAITTHRLPREVLRGSFRGAAFDSLFADLWRAPRRKPVPSDAAHGFVPRMDALETQDEYQLAFELPGLTEQDFKLVIEEGVLTLEGEKRNRLEDDDAGGAVRRLETVGGRFERRVRFDAPVDEDGVKASFKNGVLEIVVPKPGEATQPSRTVEVTSA